MTQLEGNWEDLEHKGYVVVRSFLSAPELARFGDDFHAQRLSANEGYNVKNVGWQELERVQFRLDDVLAQVRGRTTLQPDRFIRALYFSTRLVDFGWHQDQDTFWMFQNALEMLNFYIPIVKPLLEKSNVCIVPFDRLLARAPEVYRHVVGRGAINYRIERGRTRLFDENDGVQRVLPFDLELLACTPQLAAGDLLLMRGDLIHRTQDADTVRVAASLRAVPSSSMVSRRVLVEGGVKKLVRMTRNRAEYKSVLLSFERSGAEKLPVGEVFPCSPVAVSRVAFLRELLRHRLRYALGRCA